MEDLIKKYNAKLEELNSIEAELRKFSDGFIYLASVHCYGSVRWQTYTNEFTVQELSDDYNGDNGIVTIYTNNPNHTISNYSGCTLVQSLEEIQEISQKDVSMSAAIVNWISKAY